MPSDVMERNTMPKSTYASQSNAMAVIPTLNEEAHIEACIRSLLVGDKALQEIPLVIADGGSHDRTVEIVEGLKGEFPNLIVLKNPKRLQAAAINLAVEAYGSDHTDYMVRCDAHSIYPPNFILDVVDSLKSTQAASVVVPMDAIGQSCFEKANAWVSNTILGSGGSAHKAGRKSGYVDHGHHAGFDLRVFKKVGGYDDTFSHNEDAEYDARVAQQGGRIFLNADIRIQYVPRSSATALARQYFNYGKGRARTIRKHQEVLKLRQALPIAALLANLMSLIAAPFIWWTLSANHVPFGSWRSFAGHRDKQEINLRALRGRCVVRHSYELGRRFLARNHTSKAFRHRLAFGFHPKTTINNSLIIEHPWQS